jgi:hypothetical protein
VAIKASRDRDDEFCGQTMKGRHSSYKYMSRQKRERIAYESDGWKGFCKCMAR